ncbi:hypothetical protein B9Z55_003092 [Caenorhabditis nigoni]|uniref:Uncharacterized protein n=1 Tax=Caenorhabditis nigoni TaxID=1611254 RepID=A0A2G5VNK9_9PELO|nr:hypothetical protein B9Z55_003092 [Caenorhabditis nigoni]
MKFALLILLISASLFFQSEAVDKIVVKGQIWCAWPSVTGEFVKAVELWERDGFWPFHGMVDDHLKANITFHKSEEKERTYEFTIEAEEDGDGDLIETDYELYVRVLNHCALNGKAEWTDFDVTGLGTRNRWSEDKTLYAENQRYYINRWPYKRSVSGHDDNQH